MKIFALIANGPNEIKIPCRVWIAEDIDGPYADCVNLLGQPQKTLIRPMWRNEWDESGRKTHPELFTSYYGGCGECNSFELREIPQNAPFVEWNLD